MSEGGPVKFFNLDITTPIDIKAAVELTGGNSDLFYMLLPKFE